jgi:uncharacterized membrane protein SpoIIM required for sporulation
VRGFDVNRFLLERQPAWNQLEHLVQQVERGGLGTLDVKGARELGRLYRAVSDDLVRARSELVNATVVDYLNDIVARSYAAIHASSRGRARTPRLRDFFLVRFPRKFRAEWRVIVLAALVLFSGSALGAVMVAIDPHSLGALIPEDHQARTPKERVSHDESEDGAATANESIAFSGWLFTHNIQVTFLAFALGLTFGVGTLALLFFNGVPLGALAVHYHQSGLGLFFWAWILPHGVSELTEVCIAGAAGFVIARGLWLPGRRTRRDALVLETRNAVLLVLGGMPILVLAGVIEGTISQMHEPIMPYVSKLAFAAFVAIGLYSFLLRAGRDDGELHERA